MRQVRRGRTCDPRLSTQARVTLDEPPKPQCNGRAASASPTRALCGRPAADFRRKAPDMRTLLFLLVGFLLLAACMLLGRLFSSNNPGATYAATLTFVVLWLVISTANLWVGVAKAGYTLTDEFPIFLLIFGVPTIAAIFLKWRVF